MHNEMIDLHTHSSYSDGELTPQDLVITAAEKGITVIALTDHDTVAGVAEAQTQAHLSGIQCITGVEISASWKETAVHILGLHFDLEDVVLRDGLLKHQLLRRERSKKIADNFLKLGMKNIYESFEKLISERNELAVISRAHFANALIEHHYVNDYQQAFKRYLARGKPAYSSVEWTSIKQVISWINEAGGLAVIAYPTRYKLTRTKLRELVADFRYAGGSGLEVITSRTQQDEIQFIGELCREYKLLASKGSDFHGPSTWAKLGCLGALPSQYRPVWSQWSELTL